MSTSPGDNYVKSIVHETPAVDVHSHQGTGGIWQARSLWEIFSYHWLATDLRCAGCPPEVFSEQGWEPRDRMKAAAAYSVFARNTVNYWCFMNIARDLYGFQEPYVDEHNWEWLYEAVEERVGDEQWEATVLERAQVELVSAPRHHAPRLPRAYFPYEYGEYMFCPGLQRSAETCMAELGARVDSAEALAGAIEAKIASLVREKRIRALHVWVPISWTYAPTEAGPAEALVQKMLSSAHLRTEEQDALVSFTADRVAESCGKHGVVIQLFHGSVPLEEGGPQVAVYRPEWLRALAPYFSRHRGTQFDLFLATRVLSHEATVLARNYPNLWVSGAWWQGFTPSTLGEFFRDRLEMLPLNKWNAFYSDAYCVEWIYGKLALSRNRLSTGLAELLEEGLISRDLVSDLARAALHDNPLRLYREPGGGQG